MTGFRQQSLSEGILNGSRVSSRLVAIHFLALLFFLFQPLTFVLCVAHLLLPPPPLPPVDGCGLAGIDVIVFDGTPARERLPFVFTPVGLGFGVLVGFLFMTSPDFGP